MTTIVTEFQIPAGQPFPDDEHGFGPSAELVDFKPEPVRPSDVIGRRIEAIMPFAGTYGVGGPGFFAFGLGENWLIVAVWGAGDWMQAAGRPILDFFHDDYDRQKPWISQHEDELSPVLIGSNITAIDVKRTTMHIAFDSGMTISIEEDPRSRPILEGSKELRAFKPKDDLRNAVFLSPTAEIWV